MTTRFTDPSLVPGAYLLSVSASGISSNNVPFVRTGAGANNIVLQVDPSDPTIIRIDNFFITPDGKNYAYTYARVLASDLYLIRGLK